MENERKYKEKNEERKNRIGFKKAYEWGQDSRDMDLVWDLKV